MEDNLDLELELLVDIADLNDYNDLEFMLLQGECTDCQYDVAQCYFKGYCCFLARG